MQPAAKQDPQLSLQTLVLVHLTKLAVIAPSQVREAAN